MKIKELYEMWRELYDGEMVTEPFDEWYMRIKREERKWKIFLVEEGIRPWNTN